jgi:hypothetical protein
MFLKGDVTICATSNEGLDFKSLTGSCVPGERRKHDIIPRHLRMIHEASSI